MGLTRKELYERYGDIADAVIKEIGICTMSLNDKGETEIPLSDIHRAVDIVTKGHSDIMRD